METHGDCTYDCNGWPFRNCNMTTFWPTGQLRASTSTGSSRNTSIIHHARQCQMDATDAMMSAQEGREDVEKMITNDWQLATMKLLASDWKMATMIGNMATD